MNLSMVSPSKGVVLKETHGWMCRVPGYYPKLEQDRGFLAVLRRLFGGA